MASDNVIETIDGGLANLGRAVCMNTNGDLYAIFLVGAFPHDAIHISKSTDQGTTWASFLVISGGQGYMSPQIAVDSSGNLHILYILYDASSDWWLIHRSYISGTGWSVVHEIEELTSAVQGSNFPMIIDADDIIHVLYRRTIDAVINLIYAHSNDFGVNWTIYGSIDSGSYPGLISLTVDDSGNLHAVWMVVGNGSPGSSNNENLRYLTKSYADYGVGAWAVEWATAWQTGSAYDQDSYGIVVNTTGEVFILYKHQYISGRVLYCAVRDADGTWTQEQARGVSTSQATISRDATGTVFAMYSTPTKHYWVKRTAIDTWSAAVEISTNSYDYEIISLYAVFPKVGNVSVGIPSTGFAAVKKSATPSIDYYENALLPITIYPSDYRTRISSLIHRYNRGVYSLEIGLGDVRAEWSTSIYQSKAEDLEYYRWKNDAYKDVAPFAVPKVPGGTWLEPEPTTFPIIQPEMGQEEPTTLSGLLRTDEQLQYGPNLWEQPPVVSTDEARETPPPTGGTGIILTDPKKVPSCPSGSVPRFINGSWKCVPSGRFGGG